MESEKKESVDTQATTDTAQKEQKAENKNEGTKVNEQSKGKSRSGIIKNDDGSITFESQEKFEEFADKMFRKGADKVEQTSKQAQGTQNIQEDQEQKEQKETVQADYTDKIALAMAKAGVDVQKVERAARLVDMSKVLENSELDTKKLEDEINAVISEFPELKVAKEEEKEEKGFKFGATQSNSDENQKNKKPAATKRWNRFNSF